MTLFGTAGIRGPVGEITPELAVAVGRAAALEADGATFVVARDGRVTGPALADALAAGLSSAGAPVRRGGRLPTPALAFASRGRRGAVVTASHNPPGDNGIKLFRDGVEYDREAERRVEELVGEDPPPGDWDGWTAGESVDVIERYRAAVAAYARGHGADPDHLGVAVDCGNGTAGLATPQVLSTLGGRTVALNANVDGHFPARESKPTAESLSDLRAFVADGPLDLGIGHDGDADRTVVLDSGGEVVHEDTVVAILGEHFVRASDAAAPVVVTTPNASARIDERVTAAGGTIMRVRLGGLHEGIAEARADGGDVAFAAEPWKHLHPAFGGWIDGVATAAVLVRLVAAEGLDALRDPVTERPSRKENVACPEARKATAMDRIERDLPEQFPEAAVDTDYGVRIDRPDGAWILVRPSGTEPYLRLYAEGEDVEELLDRARAVVEDAVAAG